eukprot:365647-Chlamydomonas_euryale.AAC.6
MDASVSRAARSRPSGAATVAASAFVGCAAVSCSPAAAAVAAAAAAACASAAVGDGGGESSIDSCTIAPFKAAVWISLVPAAAPASPPPRTAADAGLGRWPSSESAATWLRQSGT